MLSTFAVSPSTYLDLDATNTSLYNEKETTFVYGHTVIIKRIVEISPHKKVFKFPRIALIKNISFDPICSFQLLITKNDLSIGMTHLNEE